MQFNSVEFLLFLPLFITTYYVVNKKYRILLIVLASSLFYMAFIPIYILVIFAVIINDYYTGKAIDKAEGKKRKTLFLRSIIFNILLLVIFKYLSFLGENLNAIAHFLDWNYSIGTLKFALPIGLSFYIFKSISYNIEIYRKTFHAETGFGAYASYIIFFPEVLSGPIDRPQNLIPQFKKYAEFDKAKFISGLKQIALGYFQKVVIADKLALLVNHVYGTYHLQKGPVLALTAIFFSFQIYCDFAGYSNIAIGTGKLLGFDLMENFNKPYFAKSISDFWRRWHISLTSWLRDYIFLPVTYATIRRLKRNSYLTFKKDEVGYFVGTIITMFIAGLWHGASWTFVIWGLILGVFLCFSLATRKVRRRIRKVFNFKRNDLTYKLLTVIFTFFLITFIWIFFKSASLKQAFDFISLIPSGWNELFHLSYFIKYALSFSNIGINANNLVLCLILIITILVYEIITWNKSLSSIIIHVPLTIKFAFYTVFVLIVLLIGNFTSQQFIYFQF